MSEARAVSQRMTNALSIDIEEWFQVGAFERVIRPSDWDGLESRVAANTGRALDLFAEAGVKATFFTLGWVAERQPALIRRIVAEGHELASHGWRHERVSALSPAAFRADLRRTRATLEDIAGVAVRGYRAPSFSIGRANAWALTVLAEEGYAYSSSVAPFGHDHYGWPGFPRFAHRPLPDSPLVEVPVTTARLAGRLLGFGGGFFRLLPYALAARCVRQINEVEGQPAVFYFHPWEIDPDQPRVRAAPLRSRIRHYANLGVMERKLRRLLGEFAWDRMDRLFLDTSRPALARAA